MDLPVLIANALALGAAYALVALGFVLVLNAPANDPGRPRRRSLASAMNTLVEAMQKPLSRTDQMLLEIALRRCVQALIADDAAPEKLERELLRAAEQEFAEQFPWAEPYVMPGR